MPLLEPFLRALLVFFIIVLFGIVIVQLFRTESKLAETSLELDSFNTLAFDLVLTGNANQRQYVTLEAQVTALNMQLTQQASIIETLSAYRFPTQTPTPIPTLNRDPIDYTEGQNP